MKSFLTRFFFGGIAVVLLPACALVGVRSGTQQLDYRELSKDGDFEFRVYPERIVAEVSGSMDRNSAFSYLFNYISGENRGSRKIAMTAPVEVDEVVGDSIAMTSPVEIPSEGKGGPDSKTMKMRFFLPSDFSYETAPQPVNDAVTLRKLPAQTFAVLRYSGKSSQEEFAEKSKQLLAYLSGTDWLVKGDPSFFGYDPPFTIPALRRNEVIVQIEQSVECDD